MFAVCMPSTMKVMPVIRGVKGREWRVGYKPPIILATTAWSADDPGQQGFRKGSWGRKISPSQYQALCGCQPGCRCDTRATGGRGGHTQLPLFRLFCGSSTWLVSMSCNWNTRQQRDYNQTLKDDWEWKSLEIVKAQSVMFRSSQESV